MLLPVSFEYYRPRSLAEYKELISASPAALIISGGTVAMQLLKRRAVTPRAVIDVSSIEEARGISVNGGLVEIGAATRLYQLEEGLSGGPISDMISHVASGIADPAVRTVATIGGNLALAGPSQELPVPLMLADASVLIYGSGGLREEKVRDFIRGPYRTSLARGEVLIRIRYRELQGYRWSYRRHYIRMHDHHVGIAGAVAKVSGGTIEDIRAVIAGEAVQGFRTLDLSALLGSRPADVDVSGTVKRALNDIRPASDRQGPAEYKKKVITVLTERAIAEVLGA